MYSVAASDPAERVRELVRGKAMLSIVADVVGNGTRDFAVCLSANRLAVVRCIERATPEDHTALATMISEGDFIWGAVVHDQGEPVRSLGLIESFHVSQLDQLVARLIELREACGETG